MKETYPMLSRYVMPDMPVADELLPHLRRIDKNRWYSNFGPLVTEFETRLLTYFSLKDEIAAAAPMTLTSMISCYHALQIGLQLFGMPEGAKVLVPAVTFPACPLAVRHVGAEPVLADIDPENWQLTPELARHAAARMKIDAVMPVAVYGVPVDAAGWDAFSVETGIPVLIDAAAALDSQVIPEHGLVAHSLHATKPFSVGEGGILVSRHAEWIGEARRISNFGTRERIAVQDGCNAKLSEYHGAVALAQLDRWPKIRQRRRTVFDAYQNAIAKAGLGLGFQKGIDDAVVGSLMLRLPEACAGRAEAIVASLNACDIMAHRMYLPPLYHHPHFAGLALVNESGSLLEGTAPLRQKAAFMRHSEAMQGNVFGLPFHAFLDAADIDYAMHRLGEAMDAPARASA